MVLDGGATGSEDEAITSLPVIVADVDNSSETAQEEIFGPVLAVIRASDFDDAVGLANDTRYGLTAGIATRSPALRPTSSCNGRRRARKRQPADRGPGVPGAVRRQQGFGRRRTGAGAGSPGLLFTWKTVSMAAVVRARGRSPTLASAPPTWRSRSVSTGLLRDGGGSFADFSEPVRWLRVGDLQLHLFLDQRPRAGAASLRARCRRLRGRVHEPRNSASGTAGTTPPSGSCQTGPSRCICGTLRTTWSRSTGPMFDARPRCHAEIQKIGGDPDAVLYLRRGAE